MDYVSNYITPLGAVMMASDGVSLIGLWFDGQKYFASTLAQQYEELNDLPIYIQTRQLLDCYFSGHNPGFTPLLRFRSTEFRIRVWNYLLDIPFGRTVTYGEIARRITAESGCQRMSAQAVGGAVGHNPISLIVPCHRVIAADSSLTGYAAGINRKEWLLKNEGIVCCG